MIIELFLDALYSIFNALTIPINIPMFPSDVYTGIMNVLSYIQSAVGIVANYCNVGYLLTLFGIIISIDIALALYHLIMWILKKIPVASIS